VKLRLLLGMLVVGMASACGGDDDGGNGGGGGGGGGGVQSVTLEAVEGSGKSGKAELQPGPASVDVTIEVTQGQSEGDFIHVHRGTCDSPDESEVVHDLGFTTASLGQGQIFTTINEVTTGEFVINIHEDDTEKVIMCGAIPEA
jgi:hypothetical protein